MQETLGALDLDIINHPQSALAAYSYVSYYKVTTHNPIPQLQAS